MKGLSIEERAVELAHYIIDNKDTVRGTAKKFGISKSTVHTDVDELQFLKIPEFIVLSKGLAHCCEIRVKLARKYEIQASYGIGIAEPLSIYVDCFGTNKIAECDIIKIVKNNFDLTPNGIISYLDLKKPIYSKTTNYGHFGREEFNWEKIIQI